MRARPGTPSGLGYPVRAIREGDLFYIHNFAPDRWPCGNPELGLIDTDAGPTKSLISGLGEQDRFWQLSFGRRPQAELYDLAKDPDCVNNVASDAAYATQASALREQLFAELQKQADPRVLGKGDVFDNYDSPQAKTKRQNTEARPKRISDDLVYLPVGDEVKPKRGASPFLTQSAEAGALHLCL